jgi:hypothetical protein
MKFKKQTSRVTGGNFIHIKNGMPLTIISAIRQRKKQLKWQLGISGKRLKKILHRAKIVGIK